MLRFWGWLSIDLVPGLLHVIMDLSRWFLDGVEQLLYMVQEWLRFRSGENRAVLVAKAVAGLFWFWRDLRCSLCDQPAHRAADQPDQAFPGGDGVAQGVPADDAGIARFSGRAVRRGSRPGLGAGGGHHHLAFPASSASWSGSSRRTGSCTPPIARSTLKPAPIGSHGETMLRLLRPGFHSGTIPKLYANLRRAERHDDHNSARKIEAALHHVEESISRFHRTRTAGAVAAKQELERA